ncbi:hypothetical protein [Muricoccus radiodurans]|uniref:hypothetical protein n=1 Tax=Muricoccus radiodurans TaxID=2231721 RepID=UPI003CEEFEB3
MSEPSEHPVLGALDQALLDLLEEFEEGHGELEPAVEARFERAKELMRRAIEALRGEGE